jgi:hypothetical protein
MSYVEVLERITRSLTHARVGYMLTGSFASVFYGTLRSTQDIDLVIEATPDQLRLFCESLSSEEYYIDAASALEAYRHQSQFNVVDKKTGWKID